MSFHFFKWIFLSIYFQSYISTYRTIQIFFTNVSSAWSRLFLISSTCVQNDFWRFCDAIKQKIEHLRSKNLQNWVFTFLNEFFLSFCFQFYISTCRTIQIFLPTYPPREVDYFWYLQRAFKMIFDTSATQLNKKLSIWGAKTSKIEFSLF